MKLNKLIEFRQQIYNHALGKARDAQFELVDAVLSNCRLNSLSELSLAPVHQPQWPSSYAALENGTQDRGWLYAYFCEQVPDLAVTVCALDSPVWSHPRARTLEDLRYAYSPTHAIKTSIVQGVGMSLLALEDANCARLVRLRRDRTLYDSALAYAGRGRPAIHGQALAFKDPST